MPGCSPPIRTTLEDCATGLALAAWFSFSSDLPVITVCSTSGTRSGVIVFHTQKRRLLGSLTVQPRYGEIGLSPQAWMLQPGRQREVLGHGDGGNRLLPELHRHGVLSPAGMGLALLRAWRSGSVARLQIAIAT